MNPTHQQETLGKYAETPWDELWELAKDETNNEAREELHNRQLRHWQESERNKSLLKAVDAFSDFLGALNNAIGKLRMEFESLANKHPRTGEVMVAGCEITGGSSRVCEHGQKSCEIRHHFERDRTETAPSCGGVGQGADAYGSIS